MMLELCNILKNEKIECRAHAYEIMKEQGFLPIVAEERELGFARFKDYYTQARNILGINSFTGSNKEYILANFEKMSVQKIAAHVGSKEIYVRQTISKFKRTGK